MYATSTQKRCWMFNSQEDIRQQRQKANDEYRAKYLPSTIEPDIALNMLDVDNEELLRKVVTEKGIALGDTFQPTMWPSVRWMAFVYFKRFYLRYSTMEFSPKVIMMACYYLAAKVDEFNVNINDFVANLRSGTRESNIEQILKYEPIIIHRLDYQLTVHCPFRPFEGHVMELKTHGMLGFDLETIRPHSNEFFRQCLFGDVMLLYTPTHIALAALSYGLKQLGKIDEIFREHIFRLCKADTWRPNVENSTLADKLIIKVEEICRLVEEQAQPLSAERNQELKEKIERYSSISNLLLTTNTQEETIPVDSDDE